MQDLECFLPAERRASRTEAPPLSLADFVERTSTLRLDAWQRHLCTVLESLAETRGRRILIHAPPQHGKSIIVSQRFPAWLLGRKPTHRVKLACYNNTHATQFGKIVRDLMQSDEYQALFPNPGLRLPRIASAESWTTAARAALRDAQPSFKALGLATGFVGQGADTLLVDDPYASPQDAYSELIRESVWTFWDASARVRLNEDTNVVFMFHRYHEDDIAGRLWATGEWEMFRYAARADDDPVWPDPLGRPEGEKLSPRFSEDYYRTQEASGWVWLGQFQGRPTAKGGSFFKTANLEIVESVPAGLRCCRAWDLAATAGAGDFTAGVKIGTDGEGRFWVLDVKRGQWATDERNNLLKQTAALDTKACRIHLPQDPGQAGKDQAQALTRLLAGFSVTAEPVSGAKTVRADPFSAQVNAGNVKLLKGDWNGAFITELEGFPLGRDDQVDAASDAFAELVGGGGLPIAIGWGKARPRF